MVRLIPFDIAKLEDLLRDLKSGLREICSNDEQAHAFLSPFLQQSLDHHRRVQSREPWIGYFGIESEGHQFVGLCGFKRNPDESGTVEIAYGIMPEFEGRGFATEMAMELARIALQSPAVCCVIAHTLPEENASGRVPAKGRNDKCGRSDGPGGRQGLALGIEAPS
jgi:RimJ/RimL family protein N-acetyltransferase